MIKPPLMALLVARKDDYLVVFGQLFRDKIHRVNKPIIITGDQRVIEDERKMNSRG
jgi:hypothetical protein